MTMKRIFYDAPTPSEEVVPRLTYYLDVVNAVGKLDLSEIVAMRAAYTMGLASEGFITYLRTTRARLAA